MEDSEQLFIAAAASRMHDVDGRVWYMPSWIDAVLYRECGLLWEYRCGYTVQFNIIMIASRRKRRKCGHCNELLMLPVYKRYKALYFEDQTSLWATSTESSPALKSDDESQCTKDLTALKNHRILLQCLTMMRLFHMMNWSILQVLYISCIFQLYYYIGV